MTAVHARVAGGVILRALSGHVDRTLSRRPAVDPSGAVHGPDRPESAIAP